MPKNWVKKVYDRYTPFVQIIGWVIVIIPIFWMAVSVIQQVMAYDGRIVNVERSQKDYETRFDRLDNKVEDMMDFFNVPHKRSAP